ncbi:MAG: efflux RND transporter periplasmic adaptor subunit [Candidatus Aphodosoma sp.]
MKSIGYLSTFALALLSLVACGKTGEEQSEEQRIEKVRVQKLEPSRVARQLNLSVILQGYETQNVAPSVTGKIERIFVEEGDNVKKGDMIVRMDQMQYKTAKLQFANLGVELARVETLLKSGSATQQQYDQLKLSYDQTQENLDFLESNTYVKAPFNGVVAVKNYEDGELYAGSPILVLTQISTLKAEIAVPEGYFPKVRPGMNVSLVSDIYPDRLFKGVVETVFPTVDAASHTFTVKVKIANHDAALRPGMYVAARLDLGEENAMVVPYQSVLKLQGSNDRYAFVNNGGYAKRVAVRLGQRFDDHVEIISDEIHEGDEIVVIGQGRLVDGVKLEIINE